ncbi:MAG: NAD(P)-dependent oxidoreductase [Porphyromonas sp.]|nr:NAD(P)-dependent oxidoreductase [Porphyromonas sp.]
MEKRSMREKTTVLVTGAAGSIGREVVRMLTQVPSECDIRVFDLKTAKNREFFDRYNGEIEVYFGDITDRSALEEATMGVDAVIHLASIIPPLADSKPELAKKVNIEGTRNLVASLEQNSPGAFLMMASSVAIYGDRLLDPYIKVGDPVKTGSNIYAQTKLAMEETIQGSKLRHTIFRLAAIMGMQNHTMSGIMFRMPLAQIVEICTPRDTGRAFVNAISHQEELEGQIFNLGGGAECTTTYEEFLANNFRIYGLGALDFPLHAFATKNFHCGYYVDGDQLEEILKFRRDTLEDYYRQLAENITPIQRFATRLTRKQVKSYLLSKSEPYKAWLEEDREKMAEYFR